MSARVSAPWVVEMVWRDVCFAHWRADGERLESRLPAGVTLDRHRGDAWLSVVPFRMSGIHARFMPTIPGFTNVPEINLRTYVRVGNVRGVWFFSLDAASRLVVRSARITTGLPYFDARIKTSEDAAGISYASERASRGVAGGRFRARYHIPSVERTVEAGSLEAFLHERYTFFGCRDGRIFRGEVLHRPWTIGPITIDIALNTLGELIAHPLADTPDAAFFARRIDVRACAVRPVQTSDR
jgi:uncharacterized protein YqjF (DUF2071 family)